MGVFADLLGTLRTRFQLGLGGVNIKSEEGGDALAVRNPADSAYAAIRAALVEVFGDDIVINAGATEAGDDWSLTIRRPSTGMTHNLQVVWPSADPSPGQALTVASLAGDVLTLQYSTVAGGTDKLVVDTTTIAFGTGSPATMFTLPANAVVTKVQVIVDEEFDGTPSGSIGISGQTSKYMGSTQMDLTAAAGTVFEVNPGLEAEAGTEALIFTYSAGGATEGSARALVYYVIPS